MCRVKRIFFLSTRKGNRVKCCLYWLKSVKERELLPKLYQFEFRHKIKVKGEVSVQTSLQLIFDQDSMD